MQNNMRRVVDILEEGLEREKEILKEMLIDPNKFIDSEVKFVLSPYWFGEMYSRQEWVISGIEAAISWIENNISTK